MATRRSASSSTEFVSSLDGVPLAGRLLEKLPSHVASVEHVKSILVHESVVALLKQLKLDVEIPKVVKASSFSHAVWMAFFRHLCEKCGDLPQISRKFKQESSVTAVRATFVRWLVLLVKEESKHAVVVFEENKQMALLSELQKQMSIISARLDGVEKKRKREEAEVASEDTEEEILELEGRLPDNPGANSGRHKDTKAPKSSGERGASRVCQPSTTELEQAQKVRFAQAVQAVGWGVNLASLKAIEKGELLSVQLGHFVAPNMGSKLSGSVTEADGAVFSVSAEGTLKSHLESKFVFSSVPQFSGALASFVKAWKVLQPESDICSLVQFQEQMVQWAALEFFPLSVLVDTWLSHKRTVQARTPLFCWNEAGVELIKIQSFLSAGMTSRMVKHQIESGGKQGHLGDKWDKKKKQVSFAQKHLQRGPSEENAKLPCRFGDDCTRIANGTCWYFHDSKVKGKGGIGPGGQPGGKKGST
jgi:hypothetical protein